MDSVPFSHTIKWPPAVLKKIYKVPHRVRNSEMKMLLRNLDCLKICMSRHNTAECASGLTVPARLQ